MEEPPRLRGTPSLFHAMLLKLRFRMRLGRHIQQIAYTRPRRLLVYPLARHLEILVRGLLVEQRFPKPLQLILPCTLLFRFIQKFRRF